MNRDISAFELMESKKSFEVYFKFREKYPEEAVILEDRNYDGWEITKQISFLKWEAFYNGYSLAQTISEEKEQ